MTLKGLALLALSVALLCGCEEKVKPVYVQAGQLVEIAEPTLFLGWITNKATNRRELRKVSAQAGWFVGPIQGK